MSPIHIPLSKAWPTLEEVNVAIRDWKIDVLIRWRDNLGRPETFNQRRILHRIEHGIMEYRREEESASGTEGTR